MENNLEVLAGFTSTDGPGGGGAAFTIHSDGSAFTLLHAFVKLGFTPKGDLIQASDGNFYGMTKDGGSVLSGTVFKMTPAGVVTILHNFDSFGAHAPEGNLLEGPDGNFYGLSPTAGLQTEGMVPGTMFRVTPAGEFKVLFTFTKAAGYRPYGNLALGPDGNLYGMTFYGGNYNFGTVFSATLDGDLKVLHHFNGSTDGGWPYGSLTLGNDGHFYGMTSFGQGNNPHTGSIFRISPTGTFTVLKRLQTEEGSTPFSSLVQHPDGSFYGMTNTGGSNYAGTIFGISPEGDFRVLRHLDPVEGSTPRGSLVVGPEGDLYGTTEAGGDWGCGIIFRISTAGEMTVLRSFHPDTDGYITNSLLLAQDGNFYGLAANRGPQLGGTIYRITPGADFTVLVALPGSYGGCTPVGNLLLARDQYLYGMTQFGGQYAAGTIFRLDEKGGFTLLRSLLETNGYDQFDGGRPLGSLTQGQDGNLYGLAPKGGSLEMGTFFRITPEGDFTVLYAFEGGEFGGSPWGSLVLGPNGHFYGLTESGGFTGSGLIFRMTTEGEITVLHAFDLGQDGAAPRGSLLLAHDGYFYGMTALGGTYNRGTLFRVSAEGAFSNLFSFTFHEHGGTPFGDLIQGLDGNLYGMTNKGGKMEGGTIFRCSLAGEVTVLRHLERNDSSGFGPTGSLLQAPDGTLFGMMPEGGGNYGGLVFKLTPDGTYSVIHSFSAFTDGRYPQGSLLLLRTKGQG